MFVGYKSDSSGDCMKLVDPTNRFQKYFSRDITCLQRMCYNRDPSVSTSGKVLTFEGLDDQGSGISDDDVPDPNLKPEFDEINENDDDSEVTLIINNHQPSTITATPTQHLERQV